VRTVRISTSVWLAAMLVVGLALPAGATEEPSTTDANGPVTVVPEAVFDAALPSWVLDAQEQGLTEVEQGFGPSGESRVVFRYEEIRPTMKRPLAPTFRIELGWNIYIYLSRGDWFYLAGLGAAAAAGALCWWLTPALGGAIACAIAVYIISYYVISRSAPRSGWCARFVFRYWGAFVGYSLVRRSC
jgi:hypothetical protein